MANPRSLSDLKRQLSSKMATLSSARRRAATLTGRRSERDVLEPPHPLESGGHSRTTDA
jgi:hypothetical protein